MKPRPIEGREGIRTGRPVAPGREGRSATETGKCGGKGREPWRERSGEGGDICRDESASRSSFNSSWAKARKEMIIWQRELPSLHVQLDDAGMELQSCEAGGCKQRGVRSAGERKRASAKHRCARAPGRSAS